MYLWLDDQRNPADYGYDDFVWAKTAEDAIALMRIHKVDFASMNYDLGPGKTGYDVLCWMEANDVWQRFGVAIHSMNPVGRAKMSHVIFSHYGRRFESKILCM
jgi:hypothetical protein